MSSLVVKMLSSSKYNTKFTGIFAENKSYSHFFSKNISVYVIFNDQSFNDMLTNSIVSFEQLGPELKWTCLVHIVMFSCIMHTS